MQGCIAQVCRPSCRTPVRYLRRAAELAAGALAGVPHGGAVLGVAGLTPEVVDYVLTHPSSIYDFQVRLRVPWRAAWHGEEGAAVRRPHRAAEMGARTAWAWASGLATLVVRTPNPCKSVRVCVYVPPAVPTRPPYYCFWLRLRFLNHHECNPPPQALSRFAASLVGCGQRDRAAALYTQLLQLAGDTSQQARKGRSGGGLSAVGMELLMTSKAVHGATGAQALKREWGVGARLRVGKPRAQAAYALGKGPVERMSISC